MLNQKVSASVNLGKILKKSKIGCKTIKMAKK